MLPAKYRRLRRFGEFCVDCVEDGFAVGSLGFLKAGNDLALAAHQELDKVPLDVGGADGLTLDPFVEFLRARTVDIAEREHREGDAILVAAELADLVATPELLIKRVAWEAKHIETLINVVVLQLLQRGILRCETALAGHVDDECNLSLHLAHRRFATTELVEREGIERARRRRRGAIVVRERVVGGHWSARRTAGRTGCAGRAARARATGA
jgi:hypothetical protein